MKNYNIVFVASEKARSVSWGQLLVQSAKNFGDTVQVVPKALFTNEMLRDVDGAAILGMARNGTQVRAMCKREKRHLICFDKGYTKDTHWRVSVGDWQPLAYFQRFKRPSDRFDAWRMRLQPYQSSPDGSIVLAGACQNYNNFVGLGDVTAYNEEVVDAIRKHSNRHIVYRPNPSWATKHSDEFRPIEGTETSLPPRGFNDELARCHLLVTHGTSAAVTALAKGVPIMVLGGGIARPMALTEKNWKEINRPYFPNDRLRYQFFYDLAYCQWTVDEYRSGQAWQEIRLALSTLDGGKGSDISLRDQYRLMHQSPAVFRGLTTLKYMHEIHACVKKTHAVRILDYGSGKGEQYQPPYELHDIWGVAPVTCYDPALPKPYGKLPEGTFDGVICCDVMEHVPPEDVRKVLEQVLEYANKFVFFAIATKPANKVLPDGRNCHLTVKPIAWWKKQVASAQAKVGKRSLLVKVFDAEDAG